MIRPILVVGNPVLRKKAKRVSQVDKPIQRLIDDMIETMRAAPGVGLAAPQIGVPLRVVIFGVEHNPRYPDAEPVPFTEILNPVIVPLSDEMEEGWEGCLSVPGLRGVVARHARIGYTGFDPKGRRIEREVEGFHARVVQHECDHLDGILYPMRVRDFSRFGYTDVLFPNVAVAEE